MINDILALGLRVVFCGISPAESSAHRFSTSPIRAIGFWK